ncbi:SDR family NAD(P)-dependent oxidoreductase [Aestuariimicrobium ganziense]|uniref:SDR family NAD(P)-dependent oxidoreductase n=1 Tax=Aestuariimicrobium ganziense TaxID=2773677 RepID=UPI00194463E8|nr:SDR family NAD(P)-dependent oxidoreductase [Aestuariimicrobium ganziense]
MATALVTGATAGIGNTFARHLAARGDDLVLVARDRDRLNETAEQLHRAYGVDVEVLVADLSDEAQLSAVAERVESADRPIELLVNNAGFGLHAKLLEADKLPLQRQAMDVMCWAVLVLSGAAGRAMKARGHGTIINVASTSAWITAGNYSAIKSWALAYTEGLYNELKGSGVNVSALCPGWVRTEFHQRAGISANLPDIVWVDIDTLVSEALADAEKGVVISIPTFKWKAAIFVAQHGPRSFIRWFSRQLSSSRHKQHARRPHLHKQHSQKAS